MITRSDLSKGYQAVQSIHALREFVNDHPDIDREWYSKSNYLGLLSVKTEHELIDLLLKARRNGIRCSVFKEPDIGDRVTAICLAPGPKSKRLCRKLPLAMHNEVYQSDNGNFNNSKG